MLLRRFIFTLSMFFIACSSFGQAKLYLSNYVVKPDVGERFVAFVFYDHVLCSDSLHLSKEASAIFELDGRGGLHLKENAPIRERYRVELAYNGEQYEFDILCDTFYKNGVVAHRGAWKNTDTAQNGIASFKKAVELGCEASEFDVWLAKDGVPVLSHDPVLAGCKVEETASDVLEKIELGEGDYLPSLRRFLLEAKRQQKTKLFLEIKPSQKGVKRTLELSSKVVALVHELRAQAWVEYISFSYDALLRIKELDPYAKVAYLGGDKDLVTVSRDGLSGIDYNYAILQNRKNYREMAHQLGLTVNVWTVNKVALFPFFIEQQVDYITTDEPELLLQQLGRGR